MDYHLLVGVSFLAVSVLGVVFCAMMLIRDTILKDDGPRDYEIDSKGECDYQIKPLA
jgi:hypothetical protein